MSLRELLIAFGDEGYVAPYGHEPADDAAHVRLPIPERGGVSIVTVADLSRVQEFCRASDAARLM
ncbi:hypothetical protein CEJ86_07690 [Sinorhizobium meliloti]|uniref:Uncharacterized protein n=1 Tax=Rhizobium meliloti TaxID=382 RepID=A0A2J0Z506_RHIML|nr:hypothetical protein CEJ86_07690 [Sinorhizobium meliloti]